ncbi:MAG: FtsK/SpoIIIE domain-containing protein, partial [Pseudonocardia sp.]
RLVAGATGRGKGSLIFAPLRALGPAIPAGLVRVWMIDLKGGAETERAAPLFHRRAITMPDALALLAEVRDELRRRQDLMRETKTRRCAVSTDTPVELVMIDELAMLTAYGDRTQVREALRLLAEILTQGRAAGICVWGYIQEPSKDVLDVRELFTTRMCLGVTAASHVDMVLGEGARERGALADEIPADPEHAGIGYLIEPHNRLPIRFRAAYVTDHEIDELVDRCAIRPPRGSGGGDGEVIDLHPRNDRDSDGNDGDEDGAA